MSSCSPARRDPTEVDVDGIPVVVSSLDRVLWPQAGFTKGEMIDYYARVAPAMLPHLSGRPLTLGRFPGGVERDGFAQTECRGAPAWVQRAEVRLRSGQVRRQCLATNPASLVWMANQNAIEFHTFRWTMERPENPAEMIFDLDPGPGADVLDAATVALSLSEELRGSGLDPWVKTSGSLGLHVLAPLPADSAFAETKRLAREIAGRLTTRRPDLVVASTKRELREGRILVDWLQNDSSRTTVAPYSLRATPVPTASMPIGWAELEDAVRRRRPEALTFLAGDVLDRLTAGDEPEPLPRHGYGSGNCR